MKYPAVRRYLYAYIGFHAGSSTLLHFTPAKTYGESWVKESNIASLET